MKFWAAMMAIIFGCIYYVNSTRTETNIKLFCTNGRLFIQFEEKNNTWGTMWLDNQGKPVKCNDSNGNFEEKISTTTI